jgi:carbon monoxide dehydrogenase subunit G
MKFIGELTVKAPRADVFNALRDARVFASCIEGVRSLAELGPDRYAAVFDTKVAYMKFSFKVTVELTRADPPREIEARIEGAPLGVVGRFAATSLTTLTEAGDETKITYNVDAALTGKLGSLGQPVLRSKARELEQQFAQRLVALFAAGGAALGSEETAT